MINHQFPLQGNAGAALSAHVMKIRKNPKSHDQEIGRAAGLLLLLLASTAQGQTYNSRCGWTNGVYACWSKTETPNSVTSTLCASGGIDSASTSKTEPKKPPPPGGKVIVITPP